MKSHFVVTKFHAISCLSLINSCCCSVLAKGPPAHNHKYNQPACQELYYSCGPNTRPEKWDEHTVGQSAMSALTMQSTGNCSCETNALHCVYCPKNKQNKQLLSARCSMQVFSECCTKNRHDKFFMNGAYLHIFLCIYNQLQRWHRSGSSVT